MYDATLEDDRPAILEEMFEHGADRDRLWPQHTRIGRSLISACMILSTLAVTLGTPVALWLVP
jgi:hypothetical protein